MNTKSSIIKRYILPVIAIIFCVLFDQFTKSLAITHLKGKPAISIIKGVFELQYLENRGAAFGMMQNMQLFFMIGAIIIICVIAYFWKTIPFEKKYIPLRIVGVLIISGAIGNMIDRFVHNYVVDFFYFSLIDFPIFNIADIYVTIACALFAILILFYYKEDDLSFKR